MDCVRAQNANDMYKDSGNDRRRYDAIQQQNKQIIQGVFYQALLNGRLWRCESNVYLFYDGRVFVGSKDDTSDMGQVPFNIVGSYITKEEFITFVFPALPYDNTLSSTPEPMTCTPSSPPTTRSPNPVVKPLSVKKNDLFMQLWLVLNAEYSQLKECPTYR